MRILLLPLVLLVVGCSGESSTTLSYSGIFELELDSERLAGAVLFASDELSVQTSDGTLISGRIITREQESLPEDFKLSDYPKYILNLKDTQGLSEGLAKSFEASKSEIEYSYGLDNVRTQSTERMKAYITCSENQCLSYIISGAAKDHLLSFHGKDITEREFQKLVKGIINANAQ
ncbi:hypothetical protein ACMDCT_06130 [Halomonadaceae bacterium KBTZ08]